MECVRGIGTCCEYVPKMIELISSSQPTRRMFSLALDQEEEEEATTELLSLCPKNNMIRLCYRSSNGLTRRRRSRRCRFAGSAHSLGVLIWCLQGFPVGPTGTS